jgi:hypothetical protein
MSSATMRIATTNSTVVWEVMTGSVIMQNMTVEDKHDKSLHDQGWKLQGELVAPYLGAAIFEKFLHVHQKIRDNTIYN